MFENLNDMQDYCDGKIDAPCDIRIYHKGRKYFVVEGHYDKDYFDVLEPKVYESKCNLTVSGFAFVGDYQH